MNEESNIPSHLLQLYGLTNEHHIVIYPKIYDKVNKQNPLYTRASTTCLTYNGQVLAMKQTKKNTAVPDKYIGIGGKEEILIDGKQCGEFVELGKIFKAKSERVLGDLDMKQSAIREVEEETSDYYIDEVGNLNLLKNGLRMDYDRLCPIGKSHTRLIKPDKTVCWEIDSFLYPLNDEEVNQLSNLSLQNREGFLTWIDERKLLDNLTISDCSILMNKNPQCTTYEIRDMVNNCNVFQFENQETQSLVTFFNKEFVNGFNSPQEEFCQ